MLHRMPLAKLNLYSCGLLQGHLDALKGMPLTELNLYRCYNIEGDREAFQQARPKCDFTF